MAILLLAAVFAAAAAGLLLFLCYTPRGFVSLPTGFLLRLSAAMARRDPVPFEVAARRLKNDKDIPVVCAKPSGSLSVEDRSIDGPGGRIPLRLYGPVDGKPDAVLLFLHGGGWVVGGIGSYDPVARSLCLASGALVVSVEYRMAPEHPFPAAVDDVLASYGWILGEMASGRIGARKAFVAGDSAGGNLATVLCLQARDKGLPLPAGQILFYPVTDLSRTDTASYGLFAKGFLLERGEMEWFISLYAPEEAQRKDPRASPLLAADLAGLPPALVFTAGFDVLRDEGEAYAGALRAAGVKVTSRRMRSLVHGFLCMSRFVPSAGRCVRKAAAFMRAVSRGGAPSRSR